MIIIKEKGAYGQVYKVQDKKTKRFFAIKKIEKAKIMQKGMVTQIQNQIKIMYSIKHPNIVRIFEYFETEQHLCLVLQYVQKGSLFKLLRERRYFDEYTAVNYLKDVISAVDYLHNKSPPIIHRDIKPENILINFKNQAKLSDFGWSNFSDILRVTYCGTQSYLAPEMIHKKGHDEKLDYWCLGVLTYQLLTGSPPFDVRYSVDENQRRHILHQNILNLRYSFPKRISQVAKDFIKGLLQLDPTKRMNIKQMRSHEFLKQKESIPEVIKSKTSENQLTSIQQQDSVSFSSKIKDLEEEINRLEINNGYLEQQNTIHKQFISKLNSKIKTLEEYQQKWNVSEKLLDIEMKNRNKKQLQLMKAQKIVIKLKNQIEHLKDQNLELSYEINRLQKQNAIVKQENQNLNKQLYQKAEQLLGKPINKPDKLENILKDEDFQFQVLNSLKTIKLLFKLNEQKANAILQKQSQQTLLRKQIQNQAQQLEQLRKYGVPNNLQQEYTIKINALICQHNFQIEKLLHMRR